LVEQIRKGQCVLFLGAGIHASSTNPKFVYADEERPLQAAKLAMELVAGTNYKSLLPRASDEDLQKAAAFAEALSGREHLLTSLALHLQRGSPSPALRMLARMPFCIFVTTNYDNMLEQALLAENKKPTKLVYDPNLEWTPDAEEDPTSRSPLVFKMHGDLEQPRSIVITDDDYITFVQKMSYLGGPSFPIPLTVRYRLGRWPTLFIGYSLQDFNLRLLLRSRDLANTLMCCSVDPSPDPLIRHLWEDVRRMIRFLEYDLWDFIPWLYQEVCGQDYHP